MSKSKGLLHLSGLYKERTIWNYFKCDEKSISCL